MDSPCVSVIVPIYNVENYLDRCVKSIINQTYKDIEIILVDDGSPDSCPQKCDEWEEKDERIKVIHKQNAGLGYARNSGLEIATGKYVYFVDSDDYLHLSAIETLYGEAVENDLDICFAGVFNEGKDGKRTEIHPQFSGKIFSGEEIVGTVLAGMLGADTSGKSETSLLMSVWQGIYRRSWIEENKLRFPSERQFISEDIIFHLDALPKAKSLKYIYDCVYYHIVDNADSLTHKYNPDRFNKVCLLYLEEKRRIEMLTDSDNLLLRAQHLFLGNVRVCLKQIVAKSQAEGKKFALTEIDKIVNNETLINVLNEYPYRKNPFKQAIMSWLLQRKMLYSVYFVTKIFIG